MPVPPHLPPGSRRDLFRSLAGDWLKDLVERTEARVVQRRYLRPPGALPEMGFLAACTRCGDCGTACPVDAIVPLPPEAGLAAGTPHIRPEVQPCIACADMPCAEACPTDALTVPAAKWTGYRLGSLELDPHRCVTFRGRVCRECATACPVGEAALVIDAQGHPVIRREGCVGCGACVKACITTPTSLTLTPLEG